MKVVGITAEYDPMHTGHIYHLGEARAVSTADFVVVAMSGDFTQRGEPALLDKWTRARIAAENGADLVLELPFAYACNSAEYFAFGAMEIFKRLGVVTHVAFGAESPDVAVLKSIADLLRVESAAEISEAKSAAVIGEAESANEDDGANQIEKGGEEGGLFGDTRQEMESEEGGLSGNIRQEMKMAVSAYREALRRELAAGRSFAAARGTAIAESLGPAAGTAAAAPNNLLAIEYLKFMGDMEPVLIPRTAPHHADKLPASTGAPRSAAKDAMPASTGAPRSAAKDTLPESAGAIRRAVREAWPDEEQLSRGLAGAPVPDSTKDAILVARTHLGDREALYALLMARLLTMSEDDLSRIFSVSEGMEHRMYDARRRCSSMEELIAALKTKRYPYTSISRMLMHVLVGLEKTDLFAPACTEQLYGRILAVSANGRRLLRILKEDERCRLPLINMVERGQGEEAESGAAPRLLALDIRAADLYNQATGRDLYANSDYVCHPYIGE